MAENSGRTDDRGDSDAILADQIAYYRAAAARYDEWWERTGPFDGGPEHRADWEAEISQVRAALDGLAQRVAPRAGCVGELLESGAGIVYDPTAETGLGDALKRALDSDLAAIGHGLEGGPAVGEVSATVRARRGASSCAPGPRRAPNRRRESNYWHRSPRYRFRARLHR